MQKTHRRLHAAPNQSRHPEWFLRDSAPLAGRRIQQGRLISLLFGGLKAMRSAPRALVCTLLVLCCRQLSAAETGSSWWPFGHHDPASVSQPASITPSSSPLYGGASPGTQSMAPAPVMHEVQMPQNPPTDASKSKSGWFGLHMPKLSKATPPATA